jgi:hypothetical protein
VENLPSVAKVTLRVDVREMRGTQTQDLRDPLGTVALRRVTMSQYPLANDEEGNVVEVPAPAIGWLVRRHGGGRGRPGVVYDRGGRPLVVPLDATGDDLRAAGCGAGAYRLDALGDDRRLLGVTAYTELTRASGDAEEGVAAVPSRDSEIAALARVCEAMQRTQAEQIRATVERERQLLDTIQRLTRTAVAPGPVERLRNARSEDIEVRASLRDALEQERENTRRAEKRAGRRRSEENIGDTGAPTPHWATLISTAAPLVTVAAAALGEKLGMTYEQSTELLKVTGHFNPLIDAAAAVMQSNADASDDGDDRGGEHDDEGDEDDDGDDNDGVEDNEDDDDDAEERHDETKVDGGVAATLQVIAKIADLSDPVLERKIRRILKLLTSRERTTISATLAGLPRPVVDAQIERLRAMAPAEGVRMLRMLVSAGES